jgi:hypothetical protein
MQPCAGHCKNVWIRKSLLALLLISVALATAAAAPPTAALPGAPRPIDRQALVARHNVLLTAADPFASLSVGNGQFAFTVDVTGLQTFPQFYADAIQLGTQSQWGWDSAPNPEKFTIDDVLTPYDAHGRQVLYADGQGLLENRANSERAKKAETWLRENPHRLQLGRLGLLLLKADGTPAKLEDLKNIRQVLDLWTGRITSQFDFDGQPVRVETAAHPQRDLVAVRIESPLVKDGRVGAALAFMEPGTSAITSQGDARCDIERSLQTTKYSMALAWSAGAKFDRRGDDWQIAARGATSVELALAFAPQSLAKTDLPDFSAVRQAAADAWSKFWQGGGAVDLSDSKDPRWKELERRIVLSQYLTAIQCAGSTPPQETGLVQNSWFGKFHLEMHWWHAAHFALWDRPELLERSMDWYRKIVPAARTLAQRNGYAGVRWPKMVGPQGEDSPSSVGAFLVWQQPHPIYYAELLYRANPTQATLEKYRDIVAGTAEFMASYAVWDATANAYCLGPPLIPAQESYGRMRAKVTNPTFELAYWYWGLQTAQQWRLRLGLPRDQRWDEICRGLAKPCVHEGRYEAIAVDPFTITSDHPSMLYAYGFLPASPLIERPIMDRTLDDVLRRWNWKETWGWDYPAVAMTAARLGRGEDAVSALLMDTPKNRYLPNGHVYQRPNLPLYLPGNGGLLAAVAMMAAGWDGGPQKPAPGFPAGQWTVRWENLRPMP